MAFRVDSDKIEGLVGATRHPKLHQARAVSDEQMVYILHSQACLDSDIDLTDCAYSLALDEGIDLQRWEHFQDQAMFVSIEDWRLVPDEGEEPLLLPLPKGAKNE